jgi:hypothetical protein
MPDVCCFLGPDGRAAFPYITTRLFIFCAYQACLPSLLIVSILLINPTPCTPSQRVCERLLIFLRSPYFFSCVPCTHGGFHHDGHADIRCSPFQ